VKKGDWYYSKVSRHANNLKLLVFCNYESVATQVANGMAREKNKESYAICHNLAFYVARMFHVGI
jgi:hypothetical protein